MLGLAISIGELSSYRDRDTNRNIRNEMRVSIVMNTNTCSVFPISLVLTTPCTSSRATGRFPAGGPPAIAFALSGCLSSSAVGTGVSVIYGRREIIRGYSQPSGVTRMSPLVVESSLRIRASSKGAFI